MDKPPPRPRLGNRPKIASVAVVDDMEKCRAENQLGGSPGG